MIFDVKIKAADKSSVDAALLPWRSVCEIDEIGIIYLPTGDMVSGEGGGEGGGGPLMEPIDGWHVNIRTMSDDAADALRHLEVTPVSPARAWL